MNKYTKYLIEAQHKWVHSLRYIYIDFKNRKNLLMVVEIRAIVAMKVVGLEQKPALESFLE